MADHVHMLLSIPPKYAVSQVVGYIKGKSATHIARVYGERGCNLVEHNFWSRGDFFISTVERDDAECIRHEEAEDRRLDQSVNHFNLRR